MEAAFETSHDALLVGCVCASLIESFQASYGFTLIIQRTCFCLEFFLVGAVDNGSLTSVRAV